MGRRCRHVSFITLRYNSEEDDLPLYTRTAGTSGLVFATARHAAAGPAATNNVAQHGAAVWQRYARPCPVHSRRIHALQDSLKGLSLEQLGNVDVTSVSKSALISGSPRTPCRGIRNHPAGYPPFRRSQPAGSCCASRPVSRSRKSCDSVKWAVGIRGFEGRLSRCSLVLVLIDATGSVYSPLFHGVYWEVQDTLMEDIDRIEVVRGPGGTIWGPDAVDGVINIILKKLERYTRRI